MKENLTSAMTLKEKKALVQQLIKEIEEETQGLVGNLRVNPDLISTLKEAYNGKEGDIWMPYKDSKLNILRLVKHMFYFPGLLEVKNWCEQNIFEE